MSVLRVAQIINDREIAVTGGADVGIAVGEVLLILGRPTTVVDPETNEELGEIATHKAVVRVFDVQERFCLAKTFRTKVVNVGGQGASIMGKYFEPPRYETRTETLRRSAEGAQAIDGDEAIVQQGDVVERFEGDVDDIPSVSVWR